MRHTVRPCTPRFPGVLIGTVLVILALSTSVVTWPPHPPGATPVHAQAGLYEGQFVQPPDGAVWLVWRGTRYQLWPDFLDPALFDQATPGGPISSYAQLTSYRAAAGSASLALQPFDGLLVLGPAGGVWWLCGGARYPITPLAVPAGTIDDLPRGPDLRTIRGPTALRPTRSGDL